MADKFRFFTGYFNISHMFYNSMSPPNVRKCAMYHSNVVAKMLLLFRVSKIQESTLT